MNIGNNIVELRQNKLALFWLKNGVISLALAGLYSIFLVILRTPQLAVFFSNAALFRATLIIHVNLSVLVWLLSITASIWSYNFKSQSLGTTYVVLAFCGTILIALSPLYDYNYPVMNNYIPILENIIFIFGISLFNISILLFAINILYEWIITRNNKKNKNNILIQFTIYSSSILLISVWICFIISYFQLQEVIKIVPINIEFYYELLFWSGGHLLQFLYTQILILIWVLLAECWIGKKLKLQNIYLICLYLNLFLSLVGISGHFFYDIIESEFKIYYTNHMKYCGSISPILSLSLIIYEIFHEQKNGRLFIKSSLVCSIILFLFGGLIGIFISGMNVTIPAHYHGSIVGITIAFMGFSYLSINNTEAVNDYQFSLTIYTLTIGQILHITGLVFAGGYGMLRKIPAAEYTITTKLYMGLMGIGGLIAIIGGLLFVFICGKRMFSYKIHV